MLKIRLPIVLLASLALTSVAFAGARPPTDASGRPLNNTQLRERMRSSCVTIVSSKPELKAGAGTKCGCYTDRMFKQMTPSELEQLRQTGAYSDSASAKAKETLSVCKIAQ